MPVDAVRHPGLPGLLRCAGRGIHIPRRLGTARRTGSARGTPAAGAVSRQGGWQVAGRVHHCRAGQEPGTAHRTCAACPPGRGTRRRAPGLDEGARYMTDTTIAFVHGRRVWDSRGRPTVEAEVLLEGGAVGRAMAPAGASTGSGEAVDLRDGGEAFGGYDVRRAVANVNGEIARAVHGM